ncbi:MAG: F-type H+-transporting ATPase subunit beta, partial [Planctomycetota bacterium]
MTTLLASGSISQIFGPVVDVRFPAGALPPIFSALKVDGTAGGAGRVGDVTLEVAQHMGNDVARCVAMATTDGCRRGMAVTNTGAPISVPVGDRTKGRIFNLLGEP